MIAPNSIINGDCLEVMKDIDDRSIDCIICDLPYGITACKWDLVIPFDKLWEQYKRIIKPNGAIALFGSQPFTSALVMSNPKWFKYEWIWEKNQGTNFGGANYMPMKAHEHIIVFGTFPCGFSPLKEKNYNPQFERGIPYEMKSSGKRKVRTYRQGISSLLNSRSPIKNDGYRYPKSVINFKVEHGLAPTQKPVKLIEYLIKTYTLENELILDNTAGSGTLAIAAINTNRQYICIEKDPHYFEVMRNRIANHDPFAPVKTKKPKAAPKGQLTLFDGGLAV
jgi:site-specific DNA-methyltransferase (adenine-specific)